MHHPRLNPDAHHHYHHHYHHHNQVMRTVLALLHLLPPAGGAPLSIAAFAGAPHWKLLDDAHAVEEVFCVALTLVDFLHYHEVGGLFLFVFSIINKRCARSAAWSVSRSNEPEWGGVRDPQHKDSRAPTHPNPNPTPSPHP
jgi:hypothetical protein